MGTHTFTHKHTHAVINSSPALGRHNSSELMYGSFHYTKPAAHWPSLSAAVTSYMWRVVDIRSHTSGKLELVGQTADDI